jgi:hypothetical protein
VPGYDLTIFGLEETGCAPKGSPVPPTVLKPKRDLFLNMVRIVAGQSHIPAVSLCSTDGHKLYLPIEHVGGTIIN